MIKTTEDNTNKNENNILKYDDYVKKITKQLDSYIFHCLVFHHFNVCEIEEIKDIVREDMLEIVDRQELNNILSAVVNRISINVVKKSKNEEIKIYSFDEIELAEVILGYKIKNNKNNKDKEDVIKYTFTLNYLYKIEV